jgi:hypothetical protein
LLDPLCRIGRARGEGIRMWRGVVLTSWLFLSALDPTAGSTVAAGAGLTYDVSDYKPYSLNTKSSSYGSFMTFTAYDTGVRCNFYLMSETNYTTWKAGGDVSRGSTWDLR